MFLIMICLPQLLLFITLFFFVNVILILVDSHPLHWLETVKFIIRIGLFDPGNALSGRSHRSVKKCGNNVRRCELPWVTLTVKGQSGVEETAESVAMVTALWLAGARRGCDVTPSCAADRARRGWQRAILTSMWVENQGGISQYFSASYRSTLDLRMGG